MTLHIAKFASERARFGVMTSEIVKRKQNGLNLLLVVIKRSGAFFRTTPELVLLLRCFILPALVDACYTDDNAIFSLVLQTFIVLWHNFKGVLLIELGVLMDNVFLPILENRFTPLTRKKDIIDVFLHILKSPEAVVMVYYNYDNSFPSWPLYERIISVICRIPEGDSKEKASLMPGQELPMATPEMNLKIHALRFVVQILVLQAQWCKVPGLGPRSYPVSSYVPSKHEQHQDTHRGSAPSTPPSVEKPPTRIARGNDADEPPSPVTGGGSATGGHSGLDLSSSNSRRIKDDHWAHRYQIHKAEQKLIDSALQIARSKGLKAALKRLIQDETSPYRNPKNLAGFFHQWEDSLDKQDIGDVLSNEYDSIYAAAGYKQLRKEYLRMLDFTGLTFDGGLRFFLEDCGFRLPGEAQKIDRLLQAFCDQYCRDNPDVFANADNAFTMAFALVMLNTDLHSKSLEAGKGKRTIKRMTEDEFCKNMRGVNAGGDFPREFLIEQYIGIKAKAIEWKEKRDNLQLEEEAANDKMKSRERRKKFLGLAVRKAQSRLKRNMLFHRSYHIIHSDSIVHGLFESSWLKFIPAITTLLDHTKDVEVMHLCLDGLAYGATVSIRLELETERKGFTELLAKVVFSEMNKDDPKLKEKIIQGHHLLQDWYKRLGIQSERKPTQACKVVLEKHQQIKKRISYEHQQAQLRRIEQDFGETISLVDSVRSFVKQGALRKVSEKNNTHRLYHFFLFSHLLLYAGDGVQTKFTIHRVIHLSLMRLVDITSHPSGTAFKIASPQKSFIVLAKTLEEKQEWLQLLTLQGNMVMKERQEYMDALMAGKESTKAEVDEEEDEKEVLRRYSTFVGAFNSGTELNTAAGKTLQSQLDEAKKQKSYCKLCIRPFKFYRQRTSCKWCRDLICGDCCAQKASLPGQEKKGKKKVCDACFGVLNGMVGVDVPFLITQEQEKELKVPLTMAMPGSYPRNSLKQLAGPDARDSTGNVSAVDE
eukprot:gb/GEZN01000780.1/.p1 GENE.gb/GEZN01000780.1/~~gb/GEZN01000780.1/.p1  ORF type:complete len:1153 (-),score=168.85 gb/GEZN01000780.1/:253-3216(-)